MNRLLLAITLLASCEGRCREQDAVSDEVPGGMCAANNSGGGVGICLRGDEVFTCAVQGQVLYTATCVRVGKIARTP